MHHLVHCGRGRRAITIAVKDKLFADYIAEHFDDAIVLASGVSRCKVVVREDAR
jgi:hypothetical protein